MIEDASIHTDFIGGGSVKNELFLTYDDEEHGTKPLFGNKKISTRRVEARVCPNCGKVELYVDLNENE